MMTHRNFVIAFWLAVNLALLIVFSPARTAVSPTPTSPSLPAPPPTLEAGNVQTPTDYGYNVSGLDRGPGPGGRVRPRPRAWPWSTCPADGRAQERNFGASGRQGHHPDRFEGLSVRRVTTFSRRSPRNRANRGPRCRRVEVRPTRARAQESEQAETPKPA